MSAYLSHAYPIPVVGAGTYLDDAVNEFMARFGLVYPQHLSFFVFPAGSGFWRSYNPDALLYAVATPAPF